MYSVVFTEYTYSANGPPQTYSGSNVSCFPNTLVIDLKFPVIRNFKSMTACPGEAKYVAFPGLFKGSYDPDSNCQGRNCLMLLHSESSLNCYPSAIACEVLHGRLTNLGHRDAMV